MAFPEWINRAQTRVLETSAASGTTIAGIIAEEHESAPCSQSQALLIDVLKVARFPQLPSAELSKRLEAFFKAINTDRHQTFERG